MVLEAALSPEGRLPALQELGCAKSINVINTAIGSVCRSVLGPGSKPVDPGYSWTRQSGSRIPQGGAGREASLIFPCLIFKNEISSKHGEKNPQLSSTEKTNPLGLETGKWLLSVPASAREEEGGLLPDPRPFPPRQTPT